MRNRTMERGLPVWVRKLAAVGVLPSDTEEERLAKGTLTLSATTMATIAVVWVGTYLDLGLFRSALIPLGYQIVSGASLVVYWRTKRYRLFRFTQLLLPLVLPFLLQWSLGGFRASSMIALWAFTAPVGALMFQGIRKAARWFMAFAALLIVSGILDPRLAQHAAPIPEPVVVAFFVLNVVGVTGTSWFLLRYFVDERERMAATLAAKHRELEAEQARSERLLLNVLPAPIAERLKSSERVIADAHPDVTVLFADIAGFSPLAARLPAERVVSLLDRIFSAFDALADRYGLEKVKTIGDAYMVAGGIPVPYPHHAEAVCDLALDFQREVARCATETGLPLAVRIGIDSGPVVAGVIGRRKFIYDLWGDTVNMASRMQSHGLPGSIQVTERVYERLQDRYAFESRGSLHIKGKGTMDAYLLLGRREVDSLHARGSALSP